MLRTFNCGIGMAMVTSATQAEAAAAVLRDAGESVFTIGTVVERSQARPVVRIAGETTGAGA
jgi:phosphoribosylformylglycinamidine cyclo-ligase